MKVNQWKEVTRSLAIKTLTEVGILVPLIIGLIVSFGIMNPLFLSPGNFRSVLLQTTYLGILSMGEMLPLVVGGFDMSIGTLIAFTSVVSTLTMKMTIFADPTAMIVLGIFAGLLVGLGVGLFNGLIIAFLKVDAFVVTIGSMSICAGAAFVLTKGIPVFGLPEAFKAVLGRGEVLGGIPLPFLIMIGIGIGMFMLINWTHVGRFWWAIGGNIKGAIHSGIATRKYTLLAYVLCSLLASGAALLLTARAGSGELTMGASLMPQAIAAAVLGGTAIGGGRGNIPGVLLGAFFITMLLNGMNLIALGSFIQQVVVGSFLLVAIIVDRYLRRLRLRKEVEVFSTD